MIHSLSLSRVAEIIGAELFGSDCQFSGEAHVDSRALCAGDCFVAMQGEHVDGHDYLEQALAAGAVAAMVTRRVNGCELPQLLVGNALQALAQLAAYNRDQFEGVVIAVTGSVGKTSTKNMLAALFSAQAPTLATAGNFNNEIGLPLTLLRLRAEHEYLVLEMGAAKPGDIRYLCEIAKPQHCILLNVAAAHLQGFGSLDAIASAKGEIFAGLDQTGTAIAGGSQVYVAKWRETAAPADMLTFGHSKDFDIYATEIADQGIDGVSFRVNAASGSTLVKLALLGRHHIDNALAAIAAGLACGLSLADMATALAKVQAAPGRGRVHQASAGFNVIDDTYNANPASVQAAIDSLVSCSGRRVLALAEMRELGPDSASLHRNIGEYAAIKQVDTLWLVGEPMKAVAEGFGETAQLFSSAQALCDQLPSLVSRGDTILVKGSRSTKMEQVVNSLLTLDMSRSA